MPRRRPSVGRARLALLTGVAVFLVMVVGSSWAGRPFTLSDFLAFAIVGIASGSIYAVAATGLVVTYTTSGVFNFAHGAIGMFMAFIYWELRVNRGWPAPIALVAVLGVLAPLTGAAIERLLIRRVRGAPLVNQIVVTVGLMLGFMGGAGVLWKAAGRRLDPFFGTAGFDAPGGVFVTWHRTITVAAAVVVALVLRFVLFRTRLGVAMRAVVDDPELAALNGTPSGRVSMMAWALGSTTAALAGILIAPEVGLVIGQLTLLIIDAFAAAILGRLRSLPLTYVGGLLLGLMSSYALGYLELAGRWNNARRAIPTVFLFVVLLALPEVRVQLSRVIRVRSPHIPTFRQSMGRMAVLVVLVAALGTVLSTVNVGRLTLAMITALVMLSLVPLTGWAGQVSLAPMTFAGVGAFAMLKVAGDSGSPMGLLAAGGLAAAFGVVVSLPALRLQGLYVALATMAFALTMEMLFFPQPEVFAGTSGGSAVSLERLNLLGWRFESDYAYLIFVTVAFAVLALLLTALRRSPFGRRLIALRDSPTAAATMGVNLLATKVAVFALSAGLAGVAGALLGMFRVQVTGNDFTMVASLPVLTLAVVGGISTVGGAIMGGAGTVMFVVLQDQLGWAILGTLGILGPGLAAIGLGKNPTGVVPDVAGGIRDRRQRPSEPDAGELGLRAPFTTADLHLVDDFLHLPEEVRAGGERSAHLGAARD